MASPIVKGFLIGSSLGVIFAFFGLTSSIPRGFLLGSIMGILAGITMNLIIKSKMKRK